jgi:hypothetical protein
MRLTRLKDDLRADKWQKVSSRYGGLGRGPGVFSFLGCLATIRAFECVSFMRYEYDQGGFPMGKDG